MCPRWTDRASASTATEFICQVTVTCIGVCRCLVSTRMVLGIGDLSLRSAYCKFGLAIGVWKTMPDRQSQCAVDVCFRLLLPPETSVLTDSGLHVSHRSCTGKINQRKHPRAELIRAAGPEDGQLVTWSTHHSCFSLWRVERTFVTSWLQTWKTLVV